MNSHPDFPVEQDNLTKTIKLIDREIDAFNVRRPKQKDWTLYQLYRMWTNSRRRLEEIRNEPYFGRIDFARSDQPGSIPYYIGKVGAPGVVDWRAPIANLFYESTGGHTKYVAPEGTVTGHLSRRRQYRISKGQLLELFDSLIEDNIRRSLGHETSEWSDPFLISELGRHAGDRLKDIVATIQTEQNRVIRAPYDSIVVVQGVAGSGKTTVALHRVAYLLYNNPVQLRSERILVLAPNRLFLQYIEGLLPDTLGVSNVEQETFESWAQKLIGKSVRIDAHRSGASRLARLLKSPDARDVLNSWLERHVAANILPHEDLRLAPNHLIPATRISEWFYTDYACWPVMTRFDRVRKRLQSERQKYVDTVKAVSLPTKARRADEDSKTALASFLTLIPGKDFCYEAWVSFLEDPAGAEAQVGKSARAELDEHAREARKKRVSIEDLPALAYIHTRLHGVPERDRYHHVVVDEAQDLTPLQCSVLAERCLRPSFTLVGDLAQAIHTLDGLSSWSEVIGRAFGDARVSEFGFTKSYRSTQEIVEFARSMLLMGGSDLPLPEPVLRHGKVPSVRGFESTERLLESLVETLDDAGLRYRSIALITATPDRASEIHNCLEQRGLEICLISGAESVRDGNLMVMPVEMARGLEFDAVLVLDANAETYPPGEQNLRRLYVAITRALHELHVFYTGERTSMLPDMAEERKALR